MPKNESNDDALRLSRQALLYERVKDIAEKDVETVAVDLFMLGYFLLAKQHPATLSTQDKKDIRDNYPDATEASMKERAMSLQGVLTVLAICEQTARIALDYCPDSNATPDIKRDEQVAPETAKKYTSALELAHRQAVAAGVSEFGANATMALMGVALGRANGVSSFKLARVLYEAQQVAFKTERGSPPNSSVLEKKEMDAVINEIATQLGVSKQTAKKYVLMAQGTKGSRG